MESIKTKHFEIFFTKDSVAEAEIDTIISKLELSYETIIQELEITDNFPKIKYYLYPTRSKKVEHTGEGANANTDRSKFKIFALYNKDIKPVSYHEIVHILTNPIGHPNYVLNEGLAESFSETWKAKVGEELLELSHDGWVKKFITDKTFIPITTLFNNSNFWDYDSAISYPECGSFVKFLRQELSLGHIKSLIKNIKKDNSNQANLKQFKNITNRSLSDFEKLWLEKINKSN